jgi:phenylalanyl-tRNA synthetase beta chain
MVDVRMPVHRVSHTLTMAGLEVEGLTEVAGDHVLEINVTPNRPDCLSVLGIARELAALTGKQVKMPPFSIAEEAATGFRVEILDAALCPRYAGRVIRGVAPGESPAWMRERLEMCGIRAINTVVDVTNYVLLELGHPLHAFDLGTLAGGMIRVGTAGRGRSIRTLDGMERELPEDALLIWDAERPVAVAGIMGGAETEVTGGTTDVFMESACFDPLSVRRTSRRLGLGTEAAYRFERGTDREMLLTALDRASALVAELSGGRIERAVDEYPVPFTPVSITFSPEKAGRVLGTEIGREEMTRILESLSMKVTAEAGALRVLTPPHRHDLASDADIIEEVARVHGYENIATELPKAEVTARVASPGRRVAFTVKEVLRKEGYHEAVNFSFMDPAYLDILSLPAGDRRRKTVELRNPLTREDSAMRTMLLPSLLENFVLNHARGAAEMRVFEAARVFTRTFEELPAEHLHAGGLSYVERTPSLYPETAEEFFVVKGTVQSVFDRMRVTGYAFLPSGEPFLHPGKSADLAVGGRRMGFVGEVSPQVLEKLDVKPRAPVYVFDLNLDRLLTLLPERVTYEPLPKFPPIERDVAVLLGEEVQAADVVAVIRAFPSEFIEDVGVFDVYRGKGVPEGMKSLGLGIRYRSKERTLTDEEVDSLHKSLVEHLLRETGGHLRG